MKKIGIFSPSNNVLGIFPNRTKQGIKNLNEIGFECLFSDNAHRNNNYTKQSVSERLKELNDLINQDVDILLASIGGYTSIQLLDTIDYKKIKEKKITFCGSSDITALLLAIYAKTNRIMLYGPTYTVNLCEYDGIDEYTKDNFLKCLNKKNFKCYPSTYKIDEYIDWAVLEENKMVKKKTPKENDWHIIKEGNCKGKLVGGNLSTIIVTIGTEYLPTEIFKDSIMFLEDCETNINEFCSYIERLRINGVLNNVRGIMLGKFDTNEMNENIDSFLKEYFKNYNIPIISNIDFGHVYPVLTLPIGAEAKLNVNNNEIGLEILLSDNK